MTIYQLFREKPPFEIILNMLKRVGIEDVKNNTVSFTKDTILITEEDDMFWNNIAYNLKSFYLPCKYKIYCCDLNSKKIITIIKQCLRLYNYRLDGKEKYSSGKKNILYSIQNTQSLLKDDNMDCIIRFD